MKKTTIWRTQIFKYVIKSQIRTHDKGGINLKGGSKPPFKQTKSTKILFNIKILQNCFILLVPFSYFEQNSLIRSCKRTHFFVGCPPRPRGNRGLSRFCRDDISYKYVQSLIKNIKRNLLVHTYRLRGKLEPPDG
jgi:hypothetical protein